jgi:ribosomal protein L40E
MTDGGADIFPPAPGCRLQTIVVMRPRCPKCESVDLRNNRTIDQGDGSQLRYTICRQCGERFKIALN